eukprot:jgi/Mesvir1/16124/Mv08408-RA.1
MAQPGVLTQLQTSFLQVGVPASLASRNRLRCNELNKKGKVCGPVVSSLRSCDAPLRSTHFTPKIIRPSAPNSCNSRRRLICNVSTPDKIAAVEVPDTPAPRPASRRGFDTLPEMWPVISTKYANLLAVVDNHHQPKVSLTYAEMAKVINDVAAGLYTLGTRPQMRIALFGEASHRWIVVDQAIMTVGAVGAVRGSHNTSTEELSFILDESKARAVVCEDWPTLSRLLPAVKALNDKTPGKILYAGILWGSLPEEAVEMNKKKSPCPVLDYEGLIKVGKDADLGPDPRSKFFHKSDPQDIATLVYTSGTTGTSPKEGTTLTHANLMYQVNYLHEVIDVEASGKSLVLLPPWHVYERSAIYFRLSRGIQHIFSNVKMLKKDLAVHKPEYFTTVPLVLDLLYNNAMTEIMKKGVIVRFIITMLLAASTAYIRARRIVNGTELHEAIKGISPQKKFLASIVMASMALPYMLAEKLLFSKMRDLIGIKQCVISGGGSLSEHLDDFYEMVGLEVLNGWGLTETSPVLTSRRFTRIPRDNVRGTIGRPLTHTEIKIVDAATGQQLPDGQMGLILARGPGVMRQDLGYFGNDEANAAAFKYGDGWFDTGDLGWIAPKAPGSQMEGCLTLTGRAKDTIVLNNGENVEPQPIENACQSSPFLLQVVCVGQDRKHLAALVVVDKDAVAAYEATNATKVDLTSLVEEELTRCNESRPRFKPDEKIVGFEIIEEPFSQANNMLTNTMKIKRPEVMKAYGDRVEKMYKRLRI